MSNSKALEEKEEGNRFFKDQNYEMALHHYTRAIAYDQNTPLLYGNRAQAYLNLNRPLEAIKDCDLALKLDASYVKGYLRRGAAFKMSNDYEKALEDFKKVLQFEPNNKQATQEITKMEDVIPNWKGALIRSIPFSEESGDLPVTREKEKMKSKTVKAMSKSVPNRIPLPKRVINRIPVNSFEFYCDWRELTDDLAKLNYISNIGPVKMGKIFASSMEPLIFCDILRILPSSNASFCSRLLYELSKMNKFKTLILFLEAHEEKALKDLLVDMKNNLAQAEFDYFIEKVGDKFL